MNSVVINDYEQGHFTCLTPEFFLIGIRFEPSINSVFASVYEFSFFEVIFPYFSIFLVQTNSIPLLDDKNRNIDVQPFEQNVGFFVILMKFT